MQPFARAFVGCQSDNYSASECAQPRVPIVTAQSTETPDAEVPGPTSYVHRVVVTRNAFPRPTQSTQRLLLILQPLRTIGYGNGLRLPIVDATTSSNAVRSITSYFVSKVFCSIGSEMCLRSFVSCGKWVTSGESTYRIDTLTLTVCTID
jgi:hypothetical protein